MQPRAEERIARAASKSALKKQKTAIAKADNDEAPVDGKTSKRAGKKASADSTLGASENDLESQNAEYFERIIEARAHNISDSNESGAAGGAGSAVLFSQLSLSRSLLRGVERAGYVSATPIQAQVIPYALAGKDICASAETGSGKTAGNILFENDYLITFFLLL